MKIYLYISPEKIKQYYIEVMGKQIPNEQKNATGTQGSGKLNVAVASADIERKSETENVFSTFWPKPLEELLNSRKMADSIKELPGSVKNIAQGSLCRCVCQFHVSKSNQKTGQVLVRGDLKGRELPEVQVALSCSYNHFAIETTESKVSSYAMPFVYNKASLELETVFLVLTTKLIDSTIYQILGSPLYMALPERRLPWKKK